MNNTVGIKSILTGIFLILTFLPALFSVQSLCPLCLCR